MKFEYDLKNNLFKNYNIAHGIICSRRALQKNKNKKIRKYTTRCLVLLLIQLIMLAATIAIYLAQKNELFLETMSLIIGLIGGFLIVTFLSFFLTYLTSRNGVHNGYLLVNHEGIADVCDDITTKFGWSKINLIAIKEDVVVVIADHPTTIIAKLKDKDKFIKEVKKQSKKIKIINQ